MGETTYLAETQQRVDVKKRLQGLKKSSEGSQGFDLLPVMLIGGLLALLAVSVWLLQQRKKRATLEDDRRGRREDEVRRRKRLETAHEDQSRYEVVEAKKHALAERCPVTDILRIRSGVTGSLIVKSPGHPSARVQVLGAQPSGLRVVPHQDETATIPDGDQWLVVRQAGGPRIYPVTVSRAPVPAQPRALAAATAGPGWSFFRFGRQPIDLPAIAIPLDTSSRADEALATPVRVVSLGIGSAELMGPLEVGLGSRCILRVAMPDEMDSLEFPSRVRSQQNDDVGQHIIEVAFDAAPGGTLDVLARGLMRYLDEVPDEVGLEPVSEP